MSSYFKIHFVEKLSLESLAKVIISEGEKIEIQFYGSFDKQVSQWYFGAEILKMKKVTIFTKIGNF